MAADEPLRDVLAELVRKRGFEAFASLAPLDAIQVLERRAERVGHALISLALTWGEELRALLAEDYPAIQRILLAA